MKIALPIWTSRRKKQQRALVQLQLSNGEVLSISFTKISQLDKINGITTIKGKC